MKIQNVPSGLHTNHKCEYRTLVTGATQLHEQVLDSRIKPSGWFKLIM